MIYSNNYKLLDKYDGRIQSGMTKVPMKKYGLSDAWYGGFLNSVGEIAGSPVLLLLNEKNETLAVAFEAKRASELSDEDKMLFDLPYQPKPKVDPNAPKKVEVKIPVKELPFYDALEDEKAVPAATQTEKPVIKRNRSKGKR